MRVLITGGTGFTGSHAVRRYLAQGHSVRVLDNQKGVFFEELRDAGAEIQLGSVADRVAVRRAVQGVELVHHIAAAFRAINVPKTVYKSVNVDGTRIVAEEALRAGAGRVVYCSTEGVHGHVVQPPGNEESPIAPEDYYQQTKWEGELAFRDVMSQGLDGVILRPTGIYGPGDPARFLMLFLSTSTTSATPSSSPGRIRRPAVKRSSSPTRATSPGTSSSHWWRRRSGSR
jgi:nucleoside-diphosphate-sugar epimerase